MAITHITSLAQLDTILNGAPSKLTVIDFHATWCGPCRAIAPAYGALAKQYTNVNFLKCDVDVATQVAGRYSISSMPTFVFLKGQTKVEQVRGANKAALKKAVRRHSSKSKGSTPAATSAAFPGRGQTLGGSSVAPPVAGVGIQNGQGGFQRFLRRLLETMGRRRR